MIRVLLFLLVSQIVVYAVDLGEMSVTNVPQEEMGNYVVRNPNEAILVVHTKIVPLSFESNMGIIKVDNPRKGEYRLHLPPGTNIVHFKNDEYVSVSKRLYIDKKQFKEVRVAGKIPDTSELPVVIRLEPDGVEVEIDGKNVDISGSTKLTIGDHSIELTKSGYVTINDNITVRQDNIFFEYTLEKPKLSVVEISTNPAGAEVYIDGVKLNGVTPLSDFFNSGHYPIKITRDKYLTVEERITIDPNKEKNSYSFELEPNFGWLTINTNQGATVYLNNKLASGLSNIELSPQTVDIRVEKAKCSPKQTSLIIRKGARETVDIYLDEQVGTIAISVDPPEAEIELNGDTGEHYTAIGTKIFANIPVGSYELEVSLKGYKMDKRSLRLRPDETLRERIALEEGGGGEGPLPGMVFVEIPGGSFMMGSPANEQDRGSDERQHRVTLSRFQIMTTEVTQAMWKAVMGSNPSNWKGDNLPVEKVSWGDCQKFIVKLNSQDPGNGYRLPTEAEWEYACRAGTTTRFYSGNNSSDLSGIGWYDYNSGSKTHVVGQKQPNAWGLYDMHGNVCEWCEDHYYGSYNGAPTDGSPWKLIDRRVLRGGSWGSIPRYCRSANRHNFNPRIHLSTNGFRLILIN